ncbi:hypothetical protein OSTOST_18502, partial [Ostertagia ostertagi]
DFKHHLGEAVVIGSNGNEIHDEAVGANQRGLIEEEGPVELESDVDDSETDSESSSLNKEESILKNTKEVVDESNDVEKSPCEISLIEESEEPDQETSMITPHSPSVGSERSGASYYLNEMEKKTVIPNLSSVYDDDIVFKGCATELPERAMEGHETLNYRCDFGKVTFDGEENPAEPVAPMTPVKERMMMFEKRIEKDDDDLLSHEPAFPEEEASMHVKEQVDKFERLHDEDLNESLGQFIENELIENVHVMETVHDLEKSEHHHDENLHDSALGQFHENELVENVHVMETVHDLENSDFNHKEVLNKPALDEFNGNELVENVHVMETVHDLEKSVLESESAVVDHEVEALPTKIHVQETVHYLEHEYDRSMPVCDEYVQIVSHRQDAGDASAAGIIGDETAAVNEQESAEVFCHVDLSRAEEATTKTVTVTVGETAADRDLVEETEPSNAQSTQIVVVDVNPCTENKPKLRESDTWEKEFVVASGSTASEISESLEELHASVAHEFIREVEGVGMNDKEQDESASEPAIITTEQIGELGTTEELPSMPVSFPTDNHSERKRVTRSKGQMLLPRRRLVDCCSIL